MNLWIVNQYAIPPSQPGGTRHYTLARELIRQGHEVTLIASSFDHVTRQENRLAPEELQRYEIVEGVPFLWLRTPPYAGNTLARIWNMLVYAGKIWRGVSLSGLRPPDILLGSSPHLLGALAAERLAQRMAVPFVLEVRDLWPESLVQLGKISPRHPWIVGLQQIEKYLYRRAARIITLLPGATDYLAAKGATVEKILWLPNGVDFSLSPAPTPLPIDPGFVTVMYAGAHGLANGLDSVLDAAGQLHRQDSGKCVQFRFVGEGPEKLRLQHLARSAMLPNVSFEAAVPKARIYSTLAQADVLILTLRNLELYKHGISLNKIYDYMAAARPIIIGADAFNNPVADAGAGVTVPPENATAIVNAVKQLIALSPESRWQMGLRGRRYVEAHHDMAGLAAILAAAFKQVIASKLNREKYGEQARPSHRDQRLRAVLL